VIEQQRNRHSQPLPKSAERTTPPACDFLDQSARCAPGRDNTCGKQSCPSLRPVLCPLACIRAEALLPPLQLFAAGDAPSLLVVHFQSSGVMPSDG
jgi:hypothetical protein